jgi:hypothetical protein
MESNDLYACFKEASIAHRREGYTNNWYDQEFDWGDAKEVHVTIPEKKGDLYFNVETYYPSMIPKNCIQSTYIEAAVKLYKNDKVIRST